MENTKFKHFKDDIRKTFTIYALIPFVIITLSSYVISFSMWYRTVVNQNSSINDEVSQRIESIVSSYIDKAYDIANQHDIIECAGSQNGSRGVYEEFYDFVNSMDIRCNFFVFDNGMTPVIASTTKIPEYTQMIDEFAWGITSRMMDSPDKVVLVRETWDNFSNRALSIGKAIVSNGRINGFVTFDLYEQDLARIISQNFSINVVVTDKYSNVISSTNELLINKFYKIDENFRGKSGFVKSLRDSHYITSSEILGGEIYVYTITSIGYVASIFIIIGMLLVILFVLLTITMFLSARKIADSKTRVIDKIIKAIGNVQNGNLDMLLDINTGDEFQIIAESYNKMLIDIKNLIKVNEEKARQSVLSEIKQLESQFNPHFLFNTLEMIKYMARMDPSSVNKIIVSLSSLLRYSISSNISEVTLGEDIEYTKNYLLILKYRFDKRFEYSIHAGEGTYECIVPKLIIQPIIENAIKYGFENKASLSVEINASFCMDKLIIVISNDGNSIEPEQLEEIKNMLANSKNNSPHIGLYNVQRRIQLMYGQNYGIEIESKEDSGTVVKLILPINRGDDGHAEGADN